MEDGDKICEYLIKVLMTKGRLEVW